MTKPKKTQLVPTKSPGSFGSRPLGVTFYEDRAEVTRVATVELAAGSQWIHLSGVSAFLDDRSIQVRVLTAAKSEPTDEEGDGHKAAGVAVIAASARRQVLPAYVHAKGPIEELDTQLREAELARASAQARLTRANSRRTRLRALAATWCEGLSEIPRGAATDDLAAWRAAYDSTDAALAGAMDEWFEASRALSEADDAAALAQARLAVRRAEAPICDATVEVQLDAESAGRYELEFKYRVPCAMWRPEHLARLDFDEAAQIGRIELVTYATVWQATGERWDGVELAFSTARPSQAASPPLLQDDPIWSRKKTTDERKTVTIESRDVEVAAADVAGGHSQVAQMPGVDDGGEPLEYGSKARVDLPSTGAPFRVEIASIELEAKVERVLRPERSAVAHIRALATLTGDEPLLAGPIRIVRGGSMMGRTRLDFVAPGAAFELGFGPDDAIRVRRHEHRRREESTITGSQTIDFDTDLFLSNLSDQPQKLHVFERIPVSEIEGLKVTLVENDGFNVNEADGFLDLELELEPRATKKLNIEYELKAPSKMVLPF
ncbi:MAG: hypothetical protein AUK47_26975 [Deltaproteobacteria bacterium CG2_30_63_29]|nr:MAG: hypothetical protein AUK47_26975 [Deltaproteobacteria bacterium CG2_30_63_29]